MALIPLAVLLTNWLTMLLGFAPHKHAKKPCNFTIYGDKIWLAVVLAQSVSSIEGRCGVHSCNKPQSTLWCGTFDS